MEIYVLLGNTGVGKDTLAESLVKKCQPMLVFKVVAAKKREWEQQWGIPYGALELRAVKAMIDPENGKTYHQLMVDEFLKSQESSHYRESLLARMEGELHWCCDNNVNVVCTDIRSADEVMVLDEFIDMGVTVKVGLLERDGAPPLASDVRVKRNYNVLSISGAKCKRLSYNGTPEQWLEELMEL